MAAHAEHAPHADHSKHYIKIWAILLVLLFVSVVGPLAEIRLLTMITAFGVALVKAFFVVKHFMHVNLEKKWIGYLLITMITLMVLMVGGISPDVMRHDGHRWENVAAKDATRRGEAKQHESHEKGETH
jgi:caa(3)-type oxidase subunit IV